MGRLILPETAASGMSPKAERKLDSWVSRYGYIRVGKVYTQYGYVFICEKKEFDKIKVLWACNDFAQEIEMKPSSSQRQRIQIAVAEAEAFIGGTKNPQA